MSRSSRSLVVVLCGLAGIVAGVVVLRGPAPTASVTAGAPDQPSAETLSTGGDLRAVLPVPVVANPTVSNDGRLVAFETSVDGLVPGDTNGFVDVFVLDRIDGTLTWVSRGFDGTATDGDAEFASISGLGRYVAFTSFATDLDPSDTDPHPDVYRRDLLGGTLERISVATSGQPDSEYGSNSSRQSITDDGRFVGFTSFATNLVPGDTNNKTDVFLRDTQNDTTRLISAVSGDTANGHSRNLVVDNQAFYVAFESDATNLVAGDTNAKTDVFFAMGHSSGLWRASLDNTGSQVNGNSFRPAISNSGEWVAFESDATNLVDGDTNGKSEVFLRFRIGTAVTSLVSATPEGTPGNGDSVEPVLDGDGSTIAFLSDATDLVADDTNGRVDVFLRDRVAGTTTRANVDSAEDEANDASGATALDNSGNLVLFVSAGSDLVTGDTNGSPDLFLRDVTAGTTSLASPPPPDPGGNLVQGASFEPPAVPSVGGSLFVSHGLPANTTLGPWDIEAGGVDVVGPLAANAQDGVQFVDLNGNGNTPATLGQDLFVEDGHTYEVSFQMSGNPNTPTIPIIKTVEVTFAGETQDFSFDITGHSNEDLGWEEKSFEVNVGCGGEGVARLRLRSTTEGGEKGPNIDTVRVVDTGAPPDCTPGCPPPGPFDDVSETHPFCPEITWLADSGVTGGFPDGTFRPVAPITRQAMAAFLSRYDHDTTDPACTGAGPFPDVPATHPFCAEIAWLADSGVTGGFDDGTFRPAAPITRQAMAAFLSRYDHDTEDPPCVDPGPFPDVTEAHPFCAEIAWLADSGVTGGFDDGTFRPAAPITRQAMAAFLYRYDLG